MNKYFILRPNNGQTQTAFLLEFDAAKRRTIEKRINFGKEKQPPYLLIEKTCNADNTESYTDISPVWNDVELAKKIGKRTCYDYSGLTLTVWYRGEPKSWNDYNNRKKLKP